MHVAQTRPDRFAGIRVPDNNPLIDAYRSETHAVRAVGQVFHVPVMARQRMQFAATCKFPDPADAYFPRRCQSPSIGSECDAVRAAGVSGKRTHFLSAQSISNAQWRFRTPESQPFPVGAY